MEILGRIVETKMEEIDRLRGHEEELRERAGDQPPPRDFFGALADPSVVSLIAEVKRRSPASGEIRPGLEPVELARCYEAGGARAISVLTDREYFNGSLKDLARVRAAVEVPCLRKDFILDERQVWQARAAGADAILLIVRILEDARLRELQALAEELGMAALVEAHDRNEVERAVAAGARILGINNRNLDTFETDLNRTLELLDAVPHEAVLVSESGIYSGEDVSRLALRGVDAVLVGESLVRAQDPEAKARELSRFRPGPRNPATR
jgi:indole-3-glycerol phosphate synthase